MSYAYLFFWNNGPGKYTRDGKVAEAVYRMTTRSSHIHKANGFEFSPYLTVFSK